MLISTQIGAASVQTHRVEPQPSRLLLMSGWMSVDVVKCCEMEQLPRCRGLYDLYDQRLHASSYREKCCSSIIAQCLSSHPTSAAAVPRLPSVNALFIPSPFVHPSSACCFRTHYFRWLLVLLVSPNAFFTVRIYFATISSKINKCFFSTSSIGQSTVSDTYDQWQSRRGMM